MQKYYIKNPILRAPAVMLFCVFLFSTASARPLSEYREAVWESVNELRPMTLLEITLADPQTGKAVDAALKQVLERLPENEEIEFEKEAFKVDNRWLKVESAAYFQQSDPVKRKVLILSIVERLEAIAVELDGVEFGSKRNTSKDEEKRILSDILKREEYNTAIEGEESPARRMYNAIIEWLRKFFPRVKKPDPRNSADLSVVRNVLQTLILAVVAVLVIFLIIRFGPRLIRKYRSEKSERGKQLILGEEIGPGATTANLFAEAEQLAIKGDIRGAIRKGYISLLFELSERKLIGLARHKTNRDYLSDLAKKPVKDDVESLTGNYELHWYGGREALENDWDAFKQGYNNALKR